MYINYVYVVMPDLIRHPESIKQESFRKWIPAGVYPVLDTGQE
jgi:hypothetical protein